MRHVIVVAVAVALMAAIGIYSAPTASASNAIAKQEGVACTSCHDKPGSKLLTDRGKYYELMSSLEGYDEIQATFSECTACHVRKPGSLKLTKKGKQFQWMLTDMEGLRMLVLGHHPGELDPGAESASPELPGKKP